MGSKIVNISICCAMRRLYSMASGFSQDSVVLMANEEKVRTETPEKEEVPEEKKGLLRPLPSVEKPRYI